MSNKTVKRKTILLQVTSKMKTDNLTNANHNLSHLSVFFMETRILLCIDKVQSD